MNSLPATLEITSYYRSRGANSLLLHVDDFFENYEDYIKIASTAWSLCLNKVRLSVIGGVSKRLIYSFPPRDELLKKGYILVEIFLENLIEMYNNIV